MISLNTLHIIKKPYSDKLISKRINKYIINGGNTVKKFSVIIAVLILALAFTGCTKQIKKSGFCDIMQQAGYTETESTMQVKHVEETAEYTNQNGSTAIYMQFDSADNAQLWISALRQVDKISITQDKTLHSDTRNCDYLCIIAERDYAYAIIIVSDNIVIEIENINNDYEECERVKAALGF